MRIAFLPAVLAIIHTSVFAQTFGPTPPPRRYVAPQQQQIYPPLPPQRYVPGYGPQQNVPPVMFNPNAGPSSQPYVPQQTQVPPQTYAPRQTYAPQQTYVPSQPYIPQQTYRPSQSHLPPQLGSGNVVKSYRAMATPIPTIPPPNYQVYKPILTAPPAIQQSTTYPKTLRFTVPPPSPNEAWIISRESGWNVQARPLPTLDNPNPTAFGLGQLLYSTRLRYADTAGKTYGLSIPPNATDANLQLLLMRAYIDDRYGEHGKLPHEQAVANARKFWEANHWY